MSKSKTLILPVLLSLFLVALGSSLLLTRSVAAQSDDGNSAAATRQDNYRGNSVGSSSNWDYREKRMTARTDPGSAREWSVDFEKLRENVSQKPWSPVHPGLERVRRILDSPGAVKVLARCRALGMFELTDEAFEISESNRGFGSGHFASEEDRGLGSGFLAVPMVNPGGNKFATTMLYREEDGNVMAITVDTETGDLLQAISSEDEPEPIKFDKKKWSDCFMTACGPCIAGCAFTGPLWLKCAGACCGVAAAVCAYVAIEK